MQVSVLVLCAGLGVTLASTPSTATAQTTILWDQDYPWNISKPNPSIYRFLAKKARYLLNRMPELNQTLIVYHMEDDIIDEDIMRAVNNLPRLREMPSLTPLAAGEPLSAVEVLQNASTDLYTVYVLLRLGRDLSRLGDNILDVSRSFRDIFAEIDKVMDTVRADEVPLCEALLRRFGCPRDETKSGMFPRYLYLVIRDAEETLDYYVTLFERLYAQESVAGESRVGLS